MQQQLFWTFATLAVASSAVLSPRIQLEDRWSVLKCKNGSLEGTQEFVALFKKVVDGCGTVRTTTKLFTCVVDNFGVTEDDGTPNLEKMNDFFTVVFSELILEDIPELKQDLNQCAQNFVANYNAISGVSDSSEVFFSCFTTALARFGDMLEDVCKYEEGLNPGYSATRL